MNRKSTCLICESEDNTAIRDPTHISDGGDAAVVGVVLRTQVLQLQNLRFPLQLRPNQHRYANVCKNINIFKKKKRRERGTGKETTKAKQLQRKVKEMNMYEVLMKPKWKEKEAQSFHCESRTQMK